jgi:hypothetical protein
MPRRTICCRSTQRSCNRYHFCMASKPIVAFPSSYERVSLESTPVCDKVIGLSGGTLRIAALLGLMVATLLGVQATAWAGTRFALVIGIARTRTSRLFPVRSTISPVPRGA